MTPTPPAQQEYIITEEQLKAIIDLTEEMCETPGWVINIQPIAERRMSIINSIRSRPHTSTPQWTDAEVMKEIQDAFDRGVAAAESTIDMQKHDTAIRNATLDKVIEWVDNADNHTKDPGNGKHYVCLPDLIIFTESSAPQQRRVVSDGVSRYILGQNHNFLMCRLRV